MEFNPWTRQCVSNLAAIVVPYATLAIVVLGCVALVASQPPPHDGSTNAANGAVESNARPIPDPQLIVQVQQAPPTSQEAAEEQRQKQQDSSDRRLNRTLAVSTAIVGVLQLIAIFFQVGIAIWQNRIIQRQNEIVDAQKRLMKAGLKNSQNTDRAWVHLDALDIEVAADNSRVIAIGLKNSGRTPARILEANVTVRSCRREQDGSLVALDELPDAPVYDGGSFAPPAILVAGETSRWRYRVTHTTPDTYRLLTLTPGQVGALWIYGKITYTDQFNPNRPHTTRFARQYDAALSDQPLQGGVRKFRFAHVNKAAYNEAD